MKKIAGDEPIRSSCTASLDLSKDRLMALFSVSLRINKIGDLQKLLHEILHSAITNIGAERGMIILFDESGERYQTVASESLKDEDTAFSTNIIKKTLESRETLMSADLKSDPRFKNIESVARLNILSFICVPLTVIGHEMPLGTLYVDQRIYERTYTNDDAVFLEAFANLAAIAINNTNLMEQLMSENVKLREEVGRKYQLPGVIGQSKAMQKVVQDAKRVLNDDCTVLITGESGSGKEVIAKAIHYNGKRKNQPFLAINCGAFPETLLEAELFGSTRGAYTGAIDKIGLLQAAQGGTLFMDEIHHTSEAMQVKLLRVLQDKEIRRLGGTKTARVDVRLICATNEDLQIAIEQDRFRKDFYYRINVVKINVPPLRERREDIPILARYFLEKYCKQKNKHCRGFEKQALEALINYKWTENNVRELENEIERAIVFIEDGAEIRLKDLSNRITGSVHVIHDMVDFITNEKGLPLTHQELEKKYIENILSSVAGNKSKAARIMGIPRSTLQGKMKKCGFK